MDFHKMPRLAILHVYLRSLFAPDGQTDGRTDGRTDGVPVSWSAMHFDNHPFGVEKKKTVKHSAVKPSMNAVDRFQRKSIKYFRAQNLIESLHA